MSGFIPHSPCMLSWHFDTFFIHVVKYAYEFITDHSWHSDATVQFVSV
jgi:hypothetical protein